MEKREYITDAGDKIMLPANDARVMTLAELDAKYSASSKKSGICPDCGTYCHGDCKS